jgi:uncharacterized protein (DUF1810 family)
MEKGYDLERFLAAQEAVYPEVLAELRAGPKRGHWMWFIFPQLIGLGFSPTANHYAIKSRGEALAYLRHPVLGARLAECTAAMLAVADRGLSQILGYPDDLKFRSSMTLFAELSDPGSPYHQALDAYFDGEPDQRTLDLLARL